MIDWIDAGGASASLFFSGSLLVSAYRFVYDYGCSVR